MSLEQAGELGVSRSTVRDAARREGWRRLQHGVYLLPGAPNGFRQAAQAALLAAGGSAVLCRRTAAHLYGLWPEPGVVELFLPEHERIRGLRGVRVYRTRTIRPGDLAEVDGLRTTRPARTVIDLAAVIEPPELRGVLITARQRRLLHLERVDRRIGELGPVRGIGVIRQLVWELHPEQADSILEARVRALIRAAGLPAPAAAPVRVPVPTPVGKLHVDIGWPDRRVGVEVDGLGHHSSHSDLDIDHRRGNALVLAQWRILHVGWHRLETDPDGFLAELRAALGWTIRAK